MQRRAIHTGRAVSDDTRWESAWTADDGLAPSPLSVLWLTDDPAVIYSLVWGDPPRLVEIDALTARARRDVAVRSSFDRPWPWAHPVKAVPLAPRHAVVATFDGYVLVLDLDTAEVTRVLGALGGPAERVQTSRDGQTIVAATAAQYTRLWSPAHGDKPARIAADAGAALSPDGQTLAWTPYSEDAETAPHGVVFASSAHLPGGARTVVRDSPRSLCLAFDADEHHLWSADEDGQLRRYLLTKNSPSVALGSHAGAVREILPRDPGGAVVVHDADGLLRVSADGSPPARVLKAREGERVIPSRDGRRALRVRAGEFRLVDTETGDVREYLSGHARAVRAAAFSPDGKLLATGSDDFTVRVWDARTGECVWCLEGHDDSVHGLAFAPDGERLYSVDARGTLRQWSLTQGAEIASLALPQDYARVRPGGLRVSPDGSQACVMRGAGSGRGLCEVDLLAWAPFAQRWVKFIAADARYTPDASALVAVGCDYGVYPRATTRTQRRLTDGQITGKDDLTAPVTRERTAVPVLPSLRDASLAAVSRDTRGLVFMRHQRAGQFAFWNLGPPRTLVASIRLWDTRASIDQVAHEQNSLAVALLDGTLWIWDLTHIHASDVYPREKDAAVQPGAWRVRLPTGDRVTALAFAPDERALVVGTKRGAVRVLRAGADAVTAESAAAAAASSR